MCAVCWVPFSIVHEEENQQQLCTGMLYRESDDLCFDLKINDPSIGFGTFPRRVSIPVSELHSVELMKGWRSREWQGITLVVKTNLARSMKEMPGAQQGKVALSISPSNSLLADAFVHELFLEEPLTGEPLE
jgi:hypothetical protein